MNISGKDLVQLSAFLDGELNQREINKVKERIQVDPDFQAALEELKIAKAVLKITPKLRVPRNFSLTQAQLGIRTNRPVYKNYRLAAAVMSFVFLGILILDFGSMSLGAAFIPALAPKSQEIIFESAADSAVEEEEQPALMLAEAEVDQASGEPEMVQEEVLAEAVEGMTEDEMSSAADARAEGESAPAVGAENPAETNLTSDSTAEDGEAPAEKADDLTETNLAAPSPTVEELQQAAPDLTFADESASPENQQPLISSLRVLEIIIGLAIVVLSIAAWILKRQESR